MRTPPSGNTSKRTMSDSVAVPVRGILVTHGQMGSGMVDAVHRIASPPEGALIPVSNYGMGPDELLRAVDEAAGEGPAVIFTDLQSGSCALAARFACREPRGRRIVHGTNLPMLLDFVFHRDLPLDDLVLRLVEKGREAIRAFEPESR